MNNILNDDEVLNKYKDMSREITYSRRIKKWNIQL